MYYSDMVTLFGKSFIDAPVTRAVGEGAMYQYYVLYCLLICLLFHFV